MRMFAGVILAGAASSAVAAVMSSSSASSVPAIATPTKTGVAPPYDGTPMTAWTTLSATTLTMTDSPVPTTTFAAGQDVRTSALESLKYLSSVLTSAKAVSSSIEASISLHNLPAQTTGPITSAPVIPQAQVARQDHDVFWTLNQLISTILSAQSAYDYYGWLAESISMDMHESTATFVNTACATLGGAVSCSTESLLFDTQNPPQAPQVRAEATPTAPIVWDTPTMVTAHVPPTIEARSNEDDTTTVVTKSVPIATVTQVVTPTSFGNTTCIESTTSVVCSASSCSYVNATATTVSYHFDTTLTSLSSTVVSPVTTGNATIGNSTATGPITTFANSTTFQTSLPNTTAPLSTTADLGGITSDAEGGKQMALATVGMAFFAILAFFL